MNRTRGGFTIVECLMAIVCYGLISLIAGVVIVSLTRDLRRTQADVEAQRDLAAARRRIEHVVRPAFRNDIAVSTGQLAVATAGGTVYFVQQGSNLLQRTAAGDETKLVKGRLVRFAVAATNFQISIDLAIRGDGVTAAVSERIAYRNN